MSHKEIIRRYRELLDAQNQIMELLADLIAQSNQAAVKRALEGLLEQETIAAIDDDVIPTRFVLVSAIEAAMKDQAA